MTTNAEFCERVLAIAKAQGYVLDKMDTGIGWSFAFVSATNRIAGSIQREPELALVNACKQLLPHIYLHLFS